MSDLDALGIPRSEWTLPPSEEWQKANGWENGKPPSLTEFLSIEAWAERDMPPPDRLLGDLITTTTRCFLIGQTGLGKTLLAHAIACGIATGIGFLHWRSARPGRVLIIDGEMPGELIKARAIDAMLRVGKPVPHGALTIYARDFEEEIERRFPKIGKLQPLNTEAGRIFVLALIEAIGGVDVMIFDNVMSLLVGDQKDEVPWNDTLPLVTALTAKRIGQVWLDHTGHEGKRQYGTSTKSWRFDAVGNMAPLSDDQRQGREVAFSLSFESPGKARRRTPDNWQDFETVVIRLQGDRWTSESAGQQRKPVSDRARQFHRAMLDTLAAGAGAGPGQVTRAAWMAECVRRNLIEGEGKDDTSKRRAQKSGPFRKAILDLQSAGWIGSDGDVFSDLTQTYH